MNSKQARRIRDIINPDSPKSKTVYRRVKKAFNKVPKSDRQAFLEELERQYDQSF